MSDKKIEVTVCMGSACFARGNEQNLNFIEELINKKKLNSVVKLSGSRCEGKCAEGPTIIVDGVEYNKVDKKKIEEIFEKLNN